MVRMQQSTYWGFQMYEQLRPDGTSRVVGDLRDIRDQDRLRQRNTADQTATNQGISQEFIDTVRELLDEAGNLLLRKQMDYGPTNISKAPGGPINGLRVRMHDKIARINNLIDKGVDPQNESLRDSFIDLLNYSAIAIMVLENKWPND
jgi:hypothetical protein